MAVPPIVLVVLLAVVLVLGCLGLIVWIAGLCDLLDRTRALLDDRRSTL